MKKTNVGKALVILFGSAFSYAVWRKMNSKTTTMDKVKGMAKTAVGKTTDDKSLEAEGLIEQILDASKEVISDIAAKF